MSENTFKGLLEKHLDYVHKDLNIITKELNERSYTHDLDKIFNEELYNIYNEHFTNLKKYVYGTKEYFEYEQKHLLSGHIIHGKARHHFYSRYNEIDDVNLIDLIEAVVDIRCSAKQYNENPTIDDIMKSINSKKICEYDLEKLIKNTLLYLEENND